MRYADDIVLFAKSVRAARRLLNSKYEDPIEDINGWLYHRIRMCIWKQWKKPKTKIRNLIKLGVSKDLAYVTANSRRGHWYVTHTMAVNIALTKERLTCSGFNDLANAYQSVHVNY